MELHSNNTHITVGFFSQTQSVKAVLSHTHKEEDSNADRIREQGDRNNLSRKGKKVTYAKVTFIFKAHFKSSQGQPQHKKRNEKGKKGTNTGVKKKQNRKQQRNSKDEKPQD